MASIWSLSHSLLRAKLRELRKNAGLTQTQLAQRLGRSQSYVSKAESGERNLDFLEVRAYCRACDQDFMAFVSTLEALFQASAPRWD
jgi:transcriptional regulator with XRE-family HTH domain